MSEVPLDFAELLRAALPGTVVAVDAPLRDDGEWWIDLSGLGCCSNISWTPRRGFGIYTDEAEYGSGPDEFYDDAGEALARVVKIATSAMAAVASLHEIKP